MKSSEIVYKQIKQMIIRTELKPGEVILDNDLMKKLNIGRTPIREALIRLSWEGQVRIIPRQCIMVSELSIKDMESIFQIRYSLSALEGELASKKRTSKELDELSEIIKRIKKEENDDERIMMDREFHILISKMTKNRFLEETMNRTLDLSIRLLFLNREEINSIDDHITEEYEKIHEALENQDEETASSLLKHHVETFRDKFLKVQI